MSIVDINKKDLEFLKCKEYIEKNKEIIYTELKTFIKEEYYFDDGNILINKDIIELILREKKDINNIYDNFSDDNIIYLAYTLKIKLNCLIYLNYLNHVRGKIPDEGWFKNFKKMIKK